MSPDGDGLNECWIDNELNGACILNFQLPLSSDKWTYLTNSNRIYAGGREFVIRNADAVTIERDGKKVWGKVSAHESWVLLGKKFATITNDPQRPSPPWSTVAIISGGSDLSGGQYTVGSAGHALYALLNGTGWTVGTVDVGGTFDLETEKESILACINKVQELWGGYIVWDSIAKTVSLRSESRWLNYTGYGARYAKNLKSIQRYDDQNITTVLYPFGADDLNIGSVNDGIIYLENHSHTSEELIEVWINQDIKTPQALKDAATEHLAKICKPRYKYSIEILDLRTIEGYEHETFDIGHLIDLVDEELGINDQARIIRYKYNVFQPWKCSLDVGDPIEKIAASIANSIKAADFVKQSIKPNASFQNLIKAIINTAATQINGASGDYTLVDGVSTWFERDPGTGELTGNLVRITPQGLIISSDGGITWDTAISGEGFHASAAWVGKIAAGVVQIGAATTYESGYNPSTKSRTFTSQPTPPYDIGDIWTGGPSGSIKKCKTAKAAGQTYAETDWEKAGAYFDEPGYVTATSDGIKVFDASSNLRVLIGSWLRDAIRKYGIKIIDGELYSSLIRTGGETDKTYIALEPPNKLVVYGEADGLSKKQMEIAAAGGGGGIWFYYDGTDTGIIGSSSTAFSIGTGAANKTLSLNGRQKVTIGSQNGNVEISDLKTTSTADIGDITPSGGVTIIHGDFYVTGTEKLCVQATRNYGFRALPAREGPELRYLDEGIGQLVNGECIIQLNPIFMECIEPHSDRTPWVIHLTPGGRGTICWSEIKTDSFRVQSDNSSDMQFSWTLSAIKKDCEGIYLSEVILNAN